jgi:hypothetical protein
VQPHVWLVFLGPSIVAKVCTERGRCPGWNLCLLPGPEIPP